MKSIVRIKLLGLLVERMDEQGANTSRASTIIGVESDMWLRTPLVADRCATAPAAIA